MDRRRNKSRKPAKIKHNVNFESFKKMFSIQLNFNGGSVGDNVHVEYNISYVGNNQDSAG